VPDTASPSFVTRFAPAPTGYLHLGHVVNALYVWGMAREAGGLIRLRIEDHDRQRCRLEYEQAILQDLAWLGFAADGPLVRQRDREGVYQSALARLRDQGLVYGCRCTRAELQSVMPGADGERRYPGTCRTRGIAIADGVGWRVRIEPGVERFSDRLCGSQVQDPSAQCGDLLVRDRLGNWTYHFAVVADDLEQGITDVIRGSDLLASTGRQIRLGRLLGRDTPPRFAHHPLVMKSATEKLSKSDGDTGVRDLRTAGWLAADVLARARALLPGCPMLPTGLAIARKARL
jgi:glutamyl-tRNA synthetase/glutamyl-Q tRNA(Asp) synthetase